MNPLRETFHFLYANRLKQNDPQPLFGALGVTTVLAYLNLLAVMMIAEPFTGYFRWLGNYGWQTLLIFSLFGIAIAFVQYLCWIANGRLLCERMRFERGESPNRILVFAYIAFSMLALPASGIFIHH
jgi:hypothetical protein